MCESESAVKGISPCAKGESAVKVSIEVQVAIMSRPITSYFAMISD